MCRIIRKIQMYTIYILDGLHNQNKVLNKSKLHNLIIDSEHKIKIIV